MACFILPSTHLHSESVNRWPVLLTFWLSGGWGRKEQQSEKQVAHLWAVGSSESAPPHQTDPELQLFEKSRIGRILLKKEGELHRFGYLCG